MERIIGSKLSTNRWLEAVWEPGTKIHALPGGMDMLDLAGDGEARLITVDLGMEASDSTKVINLIVMKNDGIIFFFSLNNNLSLQIRVFKGGDQITEHNIVEAPCGVVGIYTENAEPRSAVVAIGAGASVFIYKNMKPHFKYCLPHLDPHPKEREV